MKTTNHANRKTSIWLVALYCVELVLCVTLAGCGNKVLRDFDELEKEALKYGAVSVGAARVIPYDDCKLKTSRDNLKTALQNIQDYLIGKPITPLQQTTASKEDSNKKCDKAQEKQPDKPQEKKDNKAPAPWPQEIETIGLRMAALKFVQSELEDINLNTVSPTKDGFHRVVVSLDCSACVRGKAGAAVVYIDLYPYKADDWCHEAAKILKCWWKKIKDCNSNEEPKIQKRYECPWNQTAKNKLESTFKPLALSTKVPMPEKNDIDKNRDPGDWVAFCHRWLQKNKLFPRIVQVERMGRAEYLTLAEADYSTSKFGIGFTHPAGPSTEYERETRKEEKRQMESLRQLSLAFVAGDQRAGWFFMPGKTTEGKMPPTERRLRIVVDVPIELDKLAIHVHKVFLGPDLGVLDGATFSKQVEYLDKTRGILPKADKLYKKYKGTMPRHYRLIKTRMRNLLYQGWAEEIAVDMPKSKK